MTDRLAIALAQVNPTVGAIDANVARIRAARAEAAAQGADLVVFPELVVAGYPPEDLVLKPAFERACAAAVARLAEDTADGGPAMLVPTPCFRDGALYNSAALLEAGAIAAWRHKHVLPNYGVFDEMRVFQPGPLTGPIDFRGVPLGVMICEDMWGTDVARALGAAGAGLLLVVNGSPFEADKHDLRRHHAEGRVTETGLPLIYVNQVGGQDELVFDGGSFVLGQDRGVHLELPCWREAVVTSHWHRDAAGWHCAAGPVEDPARGLEAIWQALVLGLRDYVGKNGFPGVLVGLSGGIDSALVAALAVDALGPERVWCVMMPSPYTSRESLEDAQAAADALGLRYDTIDIAPAMAAYDTMLDGLFSDRTPDITEENIQSRARGMILMALSNKFGHMVVATGNKSEMSTGYATLYGDMCGGFALLKDIYKTQVFALCRWRNHHHRPGLMGPAGQVVPERILTKPPSAELKPDQRDQDSLPPYDELDAILTHLIEHEHGPEEIVAEGHDPALVARVWQMLDRAEYKRRQAPPGVKITPRAFGRDRRYPVTNRFAPRP